MNLKSVVLSFIIFSVSFGAYAQDAKDVQPKNKPRDVKLIKISKPNDNVMSAVDTENSPGSGEGLFTVEKMMSLHRINEFQVSPDGKWIVYSMGIPNIEKNKSKTDLYLISIDGKTKKQLTDDDFADFNCRWSPDGKKIAFISTRKGDPQIYTMNADGSDVTEITLVAGGVGNMQWSPDGKFFSYNTDVKIDKTVAEKYPALSKANVRIYNSLPVRHWDTWEDESYSHVFVVPSDGSDSKGRDLMPGERFEAPMKPYQEGSEIAWAPDAKEIAYTSKKVPNYVETTNSDIFLVNLVDGTTRNITPNMKGADKDPLYSPDGNWIAFHSLEHEGFESDRNRLMLYNRKTGAITELSKNVDQWVGQCVWSPDSKYIYFNAEDGATVQIYQISVPDGKFKILTKGWYNYDSGLDITSDGKTIVVGRRNMIRPTEIYTVIISNGEPKQITTENDDMYKDIKPAKITERWVTSTDGKKVQTWVLYPPDFDSTKQYPMITYCQGGPQSTISHYFSYRWNLFLMASAGYVVVAPNRRGVPGFGQAWNDAISRDWGGMPMQDILAATDNVSKERYIDKKGLAAVGASAGGYAVYWLEGNHNKRFSAFVAHAGVFDMTSMYGSTEELWFPNWENGGPYWDPKVKDYYERNSPHTYAAKWDTPIMVSAGEQDFRVPYTQALEAFTVAQEKRLPSELVLFPEENHWILHPQEQILFYKEFFRFLDRFCKPLAVN